MKRNKEAEWSATNLVIILRFLQQLKQYTTMLITTFALMQVEKFKKSCLFNNFTKYAL